MSKFITLVISYFILSTTVTANEKITSALNEYAWKKRQLIVFSPDKKNHQYRYFKQREEELYPEFKERNLHTWFVVGDNDVKLNSLSKNNVISQDFRSAYSIDKDQFRLLLVGYDQNEKLRLKVVNMNLIFAEIDQMPMRLREIQNKSL